MTVEIREFEASDCEAATVLWRATAGIVLRDVDAPDAIARYLARNPGSSFVAVERGRVVGTVLCGDDGRRGYLQHLAVAPEARRRGIGRALVARALHALEERGIHKCHLMVLSENDAARAFWKALGWIERDDLSLMSHLAPGARPGS